MGERTSFSPWCLLFPQEFGCYLLIVPFSLISQLILVPCKAHRLHSLLVVIPWQKCQAIWSPQHQHQHLMDRWHLCRVAGMKRALLRLWGAAVLQQFKPVFPNCSGTHLILWQTGQSLKSSRKYFFLERREGKKGRSGSCVSFLSTREGSDKRGCEGRHANMWTVGRKVELSSASLEPQPSFPCLPCPPLLYRSRHSCLGGRNVWF